MEIRRQRRELGRQLEQLDTEIYEKIHGLLSDDAPWVEDDRRYYSRNRHERQEFARYPENCRQPMRCQLQYEFEKLRAEHPIGRALAELKDRVDHYRDRIIACASHAKMETLWEEVVEELGNFEPSDPDARTPRKVETARVTHDKKK